MKTLLSTLAVVCTLGFAAPVTAKADHLCNGSRRVVSYMRCGTPVYAVYQVTGYSPWGQPVGQWVTQQMPHNCGVCNPRPVYGYGHSYGHHQHGCRPGSSSGFFGRPRSGISFGFGFGR